MSLYIGPYFECQNPATVRLKKYFACTTPNCVMDGREIPQQNFCSSCGKPIQQLVCTISNSTIDPKEVLARTNEQIDYANHYELHDPVHCWMPGGIGRRQGDKAYERGLRIDEWFILRICDVFPNLEMEWLNRAYAAEAKILDEFYGRENVSVQWGILNYYSA